MQADSRQDGGERVVEHEKVAVAHALHQLPLVRLHQGEKDLLIVLDQPGEL